MAIYQALADEMNTYDHNVGVYPVECIDRYVIKDIKSLFDVEIIKYDTDFVTFTDSEGNYTIYFDMNAGEWIAKDGELGGEDDV